MSGFFWGVIVGFCVGVVYAWPDARAGQSHQAQALPRPGGFTVAVA